METKKRENQQTDRTVRLENDFHGDKATNTDSQANASEGKQRGKGRGTGLVDGRRGG